MSEQGVSISLREIYDTVQEIKTTVDGIAPKVVNIASIEEKTAEALKKAEGAYDMASKHAEGLKWLWRTVAASLISGIIAALIGLFVLAIQLGIKEQVNTPTTELVEYGR